MKPSIWAAALCLFAGLACAHRTLDTTLSGRKTESMRAEAQKVESGWKVTLQLPAGEWKVQTPNEEQPVQVIPGTPYGMAQWTVAQDRWSKDRPLDLVLEGGGLSMPITVRYRRDLPMWVQMVLLDLAGGGIGIPDKK